MKKVNRKYVKTIIAVAIMAALCVGYFFYLSNRTPSADATDKAINDKEVAALTTRDIVNNYPASPKEVIKFYARITKAYYKAELTDEQIEALGRQARLLFDDELKNKQTEEQFFTALKADIEEYDKMGRYVSDYKIEESEEVQYKTFEERKYASLRVNYMLRDGGELRSSLTKYTLRQDSEGRWKILYWELVSSGTGD